MLVAWLASMSAWGCTDYRALEQQAAAGKLAAEDSACLEGARATAAPEDRVKASFVLIIDAYATRQLDRYEALLREHMALAPADPEVAFLLATWLHRERDRHDDEVMHYAKIALDGRRRWVGNKANHDDMVRSLYDTLVEAGMERAIAATANGDAEAGRYRREAKYWLAVAGPCLHQRECGPYFEVEVEGYADCDDLDLLESRAQRAMVSDAEARCLRSRFRRRTAPKARILDILVDWASTSSDGSRWDELRGWHWRLTDTEDPTVIVPHAHWLADRGDALGALDAAELALTLDVGTHRQALLRLVVEQADKASVPWRAEAARTELVGPAK